ncbi:MAG: hypothetical protein H6869_06150 [Rhodospirillales bacterium]|nr:hypothetical protein [Rhodospirillales bacterium]
MMSTNKPRKIKASYELQNKVGMGPIDEKKVAAAQAMMDTSTVDFIVIARPELDQLHTVITAAKAGKDYSAETMTAIKTPIMNLKANAGTFKYSFISDLTGSVLMLFEGLDKADKKVLQVADVLHKTILLSLAYQLSGDGGEPGQALLATFQELCMKFKPSAA